MASRHQSTLTDVGSHVVECGSDYYTSVGTTVTGTAEYTIECSNDNGVTWYTHTGALLSLPATDLNVAYLRSGTQLIRCRYISGTGSVNFYYNGCELGRN